MAQRHWVGGTAAWDGTAGTKWALTNGGAGGQAVPTAADDVFLDSGSGANTVTVTGSRVCLSLDCTGFTGTLAGATSPTLTISAGCTLVAGMTQTMAGVWLFNATTGPFTITSGGKDFGAGGVQISGVGGSWSLGDNFLCAGSLTISNGAFDANNKSVTCSTMSSSNANVRTITMGSGTWTITGTGTAWTTGNNTNLTLNSGGTIKFNAASATASTLSMGSGTDYSGTDFQVTALTGNFTFSSGAVAATLKNIDFTGYTGQLQQGSQINVNGNITLAAGMTSVQTTVGWTLTGSGTQTFTSNGAAFNHALTIANTGTATLADALVLGDGTLTQQLIISAGTFTTNNKNLTTPIISGSNSNVRSLSLGSSAITLNGTNTTVINIGNTANLTLDAGTSTITVTDPAANQKNITLNNAGTGGLAFNNLNFTGSGTLQHFGDGNTWNSITVTGSPKSLKTNESGTGSILGAGTWTISGSAGNLNTFKTNTTGARGFVQKIGGGTVSMDFMNVQDIDGLPGASVWYPGYNSVNAGNNRNIMFPNIGFPMI